MELEIHLEVSLILSIKNKKVAFADTLSVLTKATYVSVGSSIFMEMLLLDHSSNYRVKIYYLLG